ncbi:hypothetical protein ACFSM5_19685 [Lacibacterium aquatile]|uniref:Uncharacterized protein n=1 Tax=Lacibacterium aquatile TaxID=1168082 RepID=A0ABW5DXG2_9PROT
MDLWTEIGHGLIIGLLVIALFLLLGTSPEDGHRHARASRDR